MKTSLNHVFGVFTLLIVLALIFLMQGYGKVCDI